MSGPTPQGAGPSPWNAPSGPYYYPPSRAGGMRSLRGLATALLVLLLIIVAVDLAGAIAQFYRADLLADAAAGNFATERAANAADAAVGVTAWSHFLLNVATAVVFIIWQYRHAKNAVNLGRYRGLAPGWAIGGWFVPLANFVLPGVQLFQAGRASDPDLVGAPPDRTGRGPGIVIAWAILFGISIVLQGVEAVLYPTDERFTTTTDIEAAAASDAVGAVAFLFLIATAVVCIVMVRSMTGRQQRAYQAAAVLWPGPGQVWGQQPTWNAAQPWNAPAQPWNAVPPPTPEHPPQATAPETPAGPPEDVDPWRLPPR